MHLPSSPPRHLGSGVHLAALWGRVARTHAIPDDVDVDRLYLAIRERLRDPEWEVRLHALRALADLLPVSKNELAFPFNEAVDNLGHGSPTVRKAALDALKVFCLHCEDPACTIRAIVDRCERRSCDRGSSGILNENITTGLILSIPSLMSILRRRSESLDAFPLVLSLGLKLFDAMHRDVALRSMIKLRRVCGTDNFMSAFERLSLEIKDKFRVLCDVYDEDSFDVYYAPRKIPSRDYSMITYSSGSGDSTGSSSNLAHMVMHPYQQGIPQRSQQNSAASEVLGKVIIETEIAFDSDTAITMTVLEDNETEESDRYTSDESGSSDRRALGAEGSETDSEDPDVVVVAQKRVRFGGETVKIRTPDSDNRTASEEENKSHLVVQSFTTIQELPVENTNPTSQSLKKQRRSGIPLPIISKSEKSLRNNMATRRNPPMIKKKSKSLSELYDYFRSKNNVESFKSDLDVTVERETRVEYKSYTTESVQSVRVRSRSPTGFALSVSETLYPEPAASPVEPHREVEVLHNLQRSPTRSPRRSRQVVLDQDGFVLSVLRSSPERSPDPLSIEADASTQPMIKSQYDWETTNVIPRHIIEQLHNTDNWISAVRAADQLHRALLEESTVRALEPHGISFAEHMWALSDAVAAARAPAESAVCALIRGASPSAARALLPCLLQRLVRLPPSTALPHALLARLTLSQLVELLFDDAIIGTSGAAGDEARLRGAWCLARAAGPAAVLAAARHQLGGRPRAHSFYQQLRRRLRGPGEGGAGTEPKVSMLPVPIRRRAHSTPPVHTALPPRRLRPIADSAPLPGSSYPRRDAKLQPVFPLYDNNDSSAASSQDKKESDSRKSSQIFDENAIAENEDDIDESPVSTPKSPSIHIEDYSDRIAQEDEKSQWSQEDRKSQQSQDKKISQHPQDDKISQQSQNERRSPQSTGDRESQQSQYDTKSKWSGDFVEENNINHDVEEDRTSGSRVSFVLERTASGSSPVTRASTPRNSAPPSRASASLPASRAPTRSPSPILSAYSSKKSPITKPPRNTDAGSRDVRAALAACLAPPKQQEDWEAIVRGLREAERLAADPSARAPTASWRAVARATAAHVRSLRSRVARTACGTIAALFEARGKILEPETEEAAGALLDRTADVNRFLRGDAQEALAQLACGVTAARATAALIRRGATHRAGPVRAAAAGALAALVVRRGAARVLDLPPEPRTLLLRTAIDLLGDANPETRTHARSLCVALADDPRFRPFLKEALPTGKYRSIEKTVDRLRTQ